MTHADSLMAKSIFLPSLTLTHHIGKRATHEFTDADVTLGVSSAEYRSCREHHWEDYLKQIGVTHVYSAVGCQHVRVRRTSAAPPTEIASSPVKRRDYYGIWKVFAISPVANIDVAWVLDWNTSANNCQGFPALSLSHVGMGTRVDTDLLCPLGGCVWMPVAPCQSVSRALYSHTEGLISTSWPKYVRILHFRCMKRRWYDLWEG